MQISLQTMPKSSSFSTFNIFANAVQQHYKMSSVAAAEEAAEAFGYVLVPATCLSWRKRNKLGETRRVRIQESFYALRIDELTNLERKKFSEYCNNLKGVYANDTNYPKTRSGSNELAHEYHAKIHS